MLDDNIMSKSKIYHNPKGPAICATFVMMQEKIVHIDLSLSESEGFEWEVVGGQYDDVGIASWVDAYCNREQPNTILPLSFPVMPPFTLKALEYLAAVPFGTFYSYGEFASLLGSPNAARAVGGACGRNPFLLVIPCHRILAADGRLGGFSGGIEIKRRLLNFEKLA